MVPTDLYTISLVIQLPWQLDLGSKANLFFMKHYR